MKKVFLTGVLLTLLSSAPIYAGDDELPGLPYEFSEELLEIGWGVLCAADLSYDLAFPPNTSIQFSGTLAGCSQGGPCPELVSPPETGEDCDSEDFNYNKPLDQECGAVSIQHREINTHDTGSNWMAEGTADLHNQGFISVSASKIYLQAYFQMDAKLTGTSSLLIDCPIPSGLGTACATSASFSQSGVTFPFRATRPGYLAVEDSISQTGNTGTCAMSWSVTRANGTVIAQGILDPSLAPNSSMNGSWVFIPQGQYVFNASFFTLESEAVESSCEYPDPSYDVLLSRTGYVNLEYLH